MRGSIFGGWRSAKAIGVNRVWRKGCSLMRFRIFFLLFVCTIALCVSPALYGQAIGSFSGNVVDKSGSPISGATVTATSQSTGISRQAKTDDAGHYGIPLLPASIYTLRVEFPGFQAIESKDLRL